MKNYITVKKVKAEKQERDGQAGYKILYPDGYESWCPADVFEETAVAIPEDVVDDIHEKLLATLKITGKMIVINKAISNAGFTDKEIEVLSKAVGSSK